MLSTATLVFEINLTRLFSVSQFYHFAFMIVSLALLGTGASGTILMLLPQTRVNIERSLRRLSFATLVSILASYLVIYLIPFDSFTISWDPRQIVYLGVNFLALTLPFFCTGMAVGMLLNTFARQAEQVYTINLVGAAVGCLLALVSPNIVGGEGVVVLCSTIAAISTLLPFRLRKEPLSQKILLAFSLLTILFGAYELYARASHSRPPIFPNARFSPYKSLAYALQYPDSEVITQEWNSYSRVDIISSTSIRSLPGISFTFFRPPPPEKGLFIDGDNFNPVVVEGANLDFTGYLPTALAFELRPKARALILEPRGGLDALIALNQGAASITLVEENNLVRKNIPHIYQNPLVRVEPESTRSYLGSGRDEFDIIILSLTDTYHPVGSGAYSLSEDYRNTVDAYQDALARLSPDGLLVITRWLQMPPSEWLRAYIVASTALENRGQDPTVQVAAIRTFNTGVLFVKNSPFTKSEVAEIRSFTNTLAFDLVYLPGILPEEVNKFAILKEPIYYQAFTEYLSAGSKQAWLESYPFDVSPPTDDHPFFGHYFKPSQTSQILAELGKTWQPFGGAGYLVVLILLGIALVISGVLIFLPLWVTNRNRTKQHTRVISLKSASAPIAYFGLIGLGYMFIEIPLFQKFILFLGQPAYALTIVLFSVLLFSGIGSHISPAVNPKKTLLTLSSLVILNLWLLPLIVDAALGFEFIIRAGITILLLAPIGILMGIPFPSGIQILEQASPNLIPWVWGINGAASVISSIVSMLFALSFGFRLVLIAGAVCYLGAWLLLPRLRTLG